MRIPSGNSTPDVAPVSPVSQVDRAGSVSSSAPGAGASDSGVALEYKVLEPALKALREMPDVDNARVAELRDALARGELPFNATRLAALIERYHRPTGPSGGTDK